MWVRHACNATSLDLVRVFLCRSDRNIRKLFSQRQGLSVFLSLWVANS